MCPFAFAVDHVCPLKSRTQVVQDASMDERPGQQFKMRLPDELKVRLDAAAKAASRSTSAEIVYRLEQSIRRDETRLFDVLDLAMLQYDRWQRMEVHAKQEEERLRSAMKSGARKVEASPLVSAELTLKDQVQYLARLSNTLRQRISGILPVISQLVAASNGEASVSQEDLDAIGEQLLPR